MNIEIITKNLELHLYGFAGTAVHKNYAATAFALMDNMWKTVKTNNLKDKGINIWVYEPGEKVFAGVELYDPPAHETGLEHKLVTLTKYAYYKHTGPYSLIKQTGLAMTNALKSKGFEPGPLYVEIYGHWTNDETKLETELLMSIQ